MDYEKKLFEQLRQFMSDMYPHMAEYYKEKDRKDRVGIYIDPEIKESEDEKIRKELIVYFKEKLRICGKDEETWYIMCLKRWISWLEKQGDEDKPCSTSSENVQWTIKDERDDSWTYILRKYKNQKDMMGPISKDESKC